ncbi:hypothetical protein K4749_36790 [Streptomyces sp. TRM72054]|uniref:ATP-grasp domain-containing protein n=1 Tax=Streptomyces sp. TRM72054 TaxID=2870562 RepID=UPI001C8BDEDA|nr:hypothetical protein [Streptomyces sp. TRM72054]MBX9398994.1 hypothetical protein [Streptomyces sp. TRM72054]
MIVTLSSFRPLLEEFLAARGDKVTAVVPDNVHARRESGNPGYTIRTIQRWDDYTALAGLARELEPLGVTAIATLEEPCVRAAAFLRGLLGVPGQDFSSAVACTDKSVMKRRLTKAGIPVAEHREVYSTQEIGECLDELGGDIVVKPRHGFGTLNTYRVNSPQRLEELISAGAFEPPRSLPTDFNASTIAQQLGKVGYLVERYIDVDVEYHCDLLLHEGAEVFCLASRYGQPLLESSSRTIGSVLLDPESAEAGTVLELTRVAAAQLGVSEGFGHCEVLRDRSGQWWVGEFASRPGGSMIPRMLQLHYGIDTLALLAEQLTGRMPRVESVSHSGTLAWRAVPADAGVITDMTDEAQLRSLPGVVDVQVALRPGDFATGVLGTTSYAAFVFCTGDTPEQAEQRAEAARNACSVTVTPSSPDGLSPIGKDGYR